MAKFVSLCILFALVAIACAYPADKKEETLQADNSFGLGYGLYGGGLGYGLYGGGLGLGLGGLGFGHGLGLGLYGR